MVEKTISSCIGPKVIDSDPGDISPLDDTTLKLDREQGFRAIRLEERVASDSNALSLLCHNAIWMLDELAKCKK